MLIYNDGADRVQVHNLEKSLNLVLPVDYFEFLVKYNGGSVSDGEYLCFYIDGVNEELVLGRLYSVDTMKTKTLEYSDDIPNTAIIIGEEYGSGFLLLVMGEGSSDGVYFWDTSMFLKTSTEIDSSYRLCDTFSEFIEILKPLD